MNERWTIQQLGSVAEKALEIGGYDGQSSDRVRSVPDLRTIRYYTTLGLLDKPTEMQGRRALYSRRHALQLVAIKRLQSRGLSLAEVQQSLVGATDEQLRRLAGLPDQSWEQITRTVPVEVKQRSIEDLIASTSQKSDLAVGTDADRERFWAGTPQDSRDGEEEQTAWQNEPESCQPLPAVHLSVLPNVKLVFEGVEWAHLSETDRRKLSSTIEDLAATLRQQGWTRPDSSRGNHQTKRDPDHNT